LGLKVRFVRQNWTCEHS